MVGLADMASGDIGLSLHDAGNRDARWRIMANFQVRQLLILGATLAVSASYGECSEGRNDRLYIFYLPTG